MKDSGINWIGEIPAHWNKSTIGTLYSPRNERVSDKDYLPLSVTMKGVVPQLSTAAKTNDGDNRKLVKVGDFAINSRSDRRGSCGISRYDGSVSLINTVLTPRNSMNPNYYDWLFHSTLFSDEFYKWGHGIVDDLWSTNWQEMKRIIIPVPPQAEQAAIAAYLDDQCAQIDIIIFETKASIEEYKKWKAAVIFEAVTKGLDPDVAMKDSGKSQWGDMPSDWGIAKIKYVVEFEPMCNRDDLEPGTIVSYAPMECIRTDSRISKTALFSQDGSSYSSFNDGDIALAKVTPCFQNKNVCIMESLENGYAFGSSELFNLRPIGIDSRFLLYWLQTEVFIEGGVANMTGVAGLKRVPSSYIKNATITYPLREEQLRIVEYLDALFADTAQLLEEKQALLNDLEAYKKSLIYEAVTGKRKVV